MKSALLALFGVWLFFIVAYIVKREWSVPSCNLTVKIGDKPKTYLSAANCACLNGLCNFRYASYQYEGIEGFIHE